ncbi:MAG: MCE family protein [Myxococcota bacterium]
MRGFWIAIAAAGFASACSGPTYRAQLDDGAGLQAGSPVQVSGVAVGEVKEIKLVGEVVDVTFAVERGHELELHADACASAVEGTAPYLEVFPGEQPTALGQQPIPRCPLPTEELGELGEALGEGLRQLFEGMGQGMGQAAQGLGQAMAQAQQAAQQAMDNAHQAGGNHSNPPPFAAGQSGAPPCEGISVVIESRAAPSDPSLQKVVLRFRNDNDEAMRLPAIGNVLFVGANGTPLASENLPGETWFMPFDVPPNAEADVTVAIPTSGALQAIEIRQVTPASNPVASCTLTGSF